jgi:hypothetical protein
VVTAVNGNGESAPSSEQHCTPMQPVPQVVTATIGPPGTGQVTIAWSPVTGAASYNIYWSPYSTNTIPLTPSNGALQSVATGNSYTFNGQLTSGTTYYFVVTDVISNTVGTTTTTRESTASAPVVSAIAP